MQIPMQQAWGGTHNSAFATSSSQLVPLLQVLSPHLEQRVTQPPPVKCHRVIATTIPGVPFEEQIPLFRIRALCKL